MNINNMSFQQLTSNTIDVLIVGAGTAGLASAITLGKLGYKTLLIDKSPFLPVKVGECLPTKGVSSLKQLGLDTVFLNDSHIPLQGYHVKWGDDDAYEKHPINASHGLGWLLDQPKFDAMLIWAAKENGCNIQFDTQISNLEPIQEQTQQRNNQPSWQLTLKTGLKKQSLKVNTIIDASGRARVLAHYLHIAQKKTDSLVASVCTIQHQTHFIRLSHTVHIAAGINGWWYNAPVNASTSILMYFTDNDLTRPKSGIEQLALAQSLPEFQICLAQDQTSVVAGSFKQVAAYSSMLNRCAGKGWIAAGDAACSHDPLSSHGLTPALDSGYYGACALHETRMGNANGLAAYQQLMQQTFIDFLGRQTHQYQQIQHIKTDFWTRRTQTPAQLKIA